MSPTPTAKSTPSLSDARLVSFLGPAMSGDEIARISLPHLSDISWVSSNTIDGTDFPIPTVGVPDTGCAVGVYFPSDSVKEPASTGVYSLNPGTLAPSNNVSFKSDCILQHNSDLAASQIMVIDDKRETRRQFSYRDQKRNTAYVMVTDRTMAMKVILPRDGDEFHFSYNPSQTGKERMTGMMKSRNGKEPPWAEEGVSHVYYKYKNGKLADWETEKEDACSEAD